MTCCSAHWMSITSTGANCAFYYSHCRNAQRPLLLRAYRTPYALPLPLDHHHHQALLGALSSFSQRADGKSAARSSTRTEIRRGPVSNHGMDQFFRKQKPRSDPVSAPGVSPPPNPAKVPRAIVKPATVDVPNNPATPVPLNNLFPPHQSAGTRRSTGKSPVPRTPLSANPKTSVHAELTDIVEPCTPQTPKPRKRFRKKVNGLFGDQTDLKRRMAKLLRDISAADVLANCDHMGTPRGGPVNNTDIPLTLTLSQGVIQRLNLSKSSHNQAPNQEATTTHLELMDAVDNNLVTAQQSREFDFPELTATASRILGSPERLREVHRTMGRLSPRSNEQFIEEMQLGKSPKVEHSKRESNADEAKPNPPLLPRSAVIDMEGRRRILEMSPVSADRTGTPAVLRRKVRRIERGYRSADILQVRLYGNSSTDQGISPVPNRRIDRISKYPRAKVGKLDLSGYDGQGRPRLEKWYGIGGSSRDDEGQQDTENDSNSSHGRHDRPKKKRRTSPGNDSQKEPEDSVMASDPFQMLVEVAVERKESSLKAAQRGYSHTKKGIRRGRMHPGVHDESAKASKISRRRRSYSSEDSE